MRGLIASLLGRRRPGRRTWRHGLVRLADDRLGLCEVHLRDGEVVAHSGPITFEAFDVHLSDEQLPADERDAALRESIVWQLIRALHAASEGPIIDRRGPVA